MDSKHIYDFLIRIQSIAKIGLKYSTDPYALTNYKEINDLSTKFLEEFMEVEFDRPNFFKRDIYPTPNISVRVAIVNENKDKILLVKEANSHLYSLPGGWADLYDSPAETAINESIQEAGADIEVVRLIGILNRIPFRDYVHTPEYVVCFEARVKGDLKEHEYETEDVDWFDINELPNMSRKVSPPELDRILKAVLSGETIFD